MSDNTSPNDLYKNKCLYVALNILLSKIQKLEKRVAVLESLNTNIHRMYNKSTNQNNTQLFMNHINKLEVKINEQNKMFNQHIKNTNTNTNTNTNILTDELDNYMQDIDEILEFQISNTNDLKKLK